MQTASDVLGLACSPYFVWYDWKVLARWRLPDVAYLETAVRLKLRMCILIYNDASYAAEVHLFKRRNMSIDIVQFPDTASPPSPAVTAPAPPQCGRR
jgi:hypothetical protein